MIHFHNVTGNKAQVVSFAKAKPKVTLGFAPSTVTKGNSTTVTITVSGPADTPTGSVSLQRLTTGRPAHTVRTALLVDGVASFKFTPGRVGTLTFVARYASDQIYTGGTSRQVTLTVHR
jgi:Bacterial Ig-like domain (group 3)